MAPVLVWTLGVIALLLSGGAQAADIRQELVAGYAAQQAGRLGEAERMLSALAQRPGDAAVQAEALAALGGVQVRLGRLDAAVVSLDRSASMARAAGDAAVQALALINTGNLLAAQSHWDGALASYERGIGLAWAAGLPELAARAAVNGAVLCRRGNVPRAVAARWLDVAMMAADALADGADKAFLLVSLGQGLGMAERATAARLLERAATLASRVGDGRTASFAEGLRGRLAEAGGDRAAALRLTRRALFLAQSADAADSLYQWQAQLARLLAEAGQTEAAIGAYQDAIATLKSIRADMPVVDPLSGAPVFRERVGPVFLGLTDLLLRLADRNPVDRPRHLRTAIATVESFKAAELEDYFREQCLPSPRHAALESLDPQAAVLYPILLPDRVALLLTTPSGLVYRSATVGAEAVRGEVAAVRRQLESYDSERDPRPGLARLYDWLMRPVEAELRAAGTTTLVVVPDDVLRAVPFSALHDGRSFLVERMALAIVPGMELTDAGAPDAAAPTPLIGGLSVGVGEYAALPSVAEETRAVQAILGGELLLDEDFRADRIEQAMKDGSYGRIHLASHAVFAGSPEQSFIVTYDGRITLDELRRRLGQTGRPHAVPDLLTLSACETAAGDDRASLGLAGVALKAGVRSVVASLWPISDPAAASLLPEFYRHLAKPGTAKAEALRQAQLALLRDPAYRHPSFWAPFLVIGNWL